MKKRSMYIALAIVAQIGIGAFVAQSVIAQGRGGGSASTTAVGGSALVAAGGRNPNPSTISPPPPAP